MESSMEHDELKTLWAQSNRKLEASMRLNTVLLRQWNLRAVATSLGRLARGVTFELIVNLTAVVLLGGFIAAHAGEPQFAIPAIAIDVYAIALLVAGIRQLVAINALDYDEPVVAIQKRLEALRVFRIRTTLAILLFAPLMWLPIFIVAARALVGADVYAAGPAWVLANVIFGLAVIPPAIFIAKRYGGRLARYSTMRAFADAITGRELAAALESLDSIQRFEAEG
jgi:hypothetical protein